MTTKELRRFLPIALIAITVLVVLVAVNGRTMSSSTESAAESKGRDDASAAARKTPSVTAQSTEKVGGSHDNPVPILMYHVTKRAPAGTPYPDLWVSEEDFSGQMRWLKDNGYTGITMAQLFNFWDDGYKLPNKPVVLTFDDGYPSNYSVARPVLRRLGWPGTLFLELNNVDSPKTGFTKRMVRRMVESGWEVGSHTISHPDLTTVGPAQLAREVKLSKKRIARTYGVDVDFFCYPAGRYDEKVLSAVKNAGYRGATTTLHGFATPNKPLELKRLRINGDDGVAGFAAKLRQAGK